MSDADTAAVDPEAETTIVESQVFTEGAVRESGIRQEHLHTADGIELVAVAVGSEGEWLPREYREAVYGYVATGTVELGWGVSDGDESATVTVDTDESATVTVDTDEFFHLPAGTPPTVSARDGEPARLLVGFEVTDGTASHGSNGTDSETPRERAASVRVAGSESWEPAGQLENVRRETPFDDTEECFHIRAGFVHRDRSDSPGRQEYVLWLTGSEPRTVTVGEPVESREYDG